ncbi:MAG: DUF2157 domain-containing protein, partial [Endomicrobium sp.]|nr:DUF2157 domain-containing protein [Endomicrobium sp.]
MDKQIDQWLKAGIITSKQAEEMQKTEQKPSSKTKKKFLKILSISAAIIAAAVIIYFVLSEWDIVPGGIQIIILMLLTFTAASLGYRFKFVKPRPKIAALLFFLSFIFLGNLIFTTAYVYSINPDYNFHYLILLWITALLPFAYIFHSKAIAVFSSLLFILWFSLFILIEDKAVYISALLFPFTYYVLGLFFFCFGKINEFSKPALPIAGAFQKIGLSIICISAYLMTFNFFVSSGGKLVFDIKIGRASCRERVSRHGY